MNDNTPLSVTTTQTLTLTADTETTFEVDVPGAAVGDFVQVSLGQGASLIKWVTGCVTTAGKVKITAKAASTASGAVVGFKVKLSKV